MEGMSLGGVASDWYCVRYRNPPCNRRPRHTHTHASAARYPMDNRNVIDVSLCVIKQCGMYAKEYKNWISRTNMVPLIVKTINSFKEDWTKAIALVNQTAVLALQHGYGMTAVDNNALVALFCDSLANFGAVYTAMQETMKSQADSLVAIQNQLANIQQFCMPAGQQPPSSGYAPAQQQCMFTNHNKRNGGQDVFCFAMLANAITGTMYKDITGAFLQKYAMHVCCLHLQS
jgi:hypothetical protein